MYKNVYFRINTPSYYPKNQSWIGFGNQEDKEQFHNTALNIFLNDGWQLKEDRYKSAGSCDTVTKDKQELYLHPQSFSGVILEENIPYIEQLINNSNNNTFRHTNTDIYEDVFDISNEEYLSLLESKKQFIEQDLLEIYKTKRSNLYITNNLTDRVLDKYKIKRLSHYIGGYSSGNADWLYVEGIFQELVNRGEIVTANTKHGTGYRTKTKKDKKIA